MTPAWSQAHTAPRLHIPTTMKLPRHGGCWCKGPRPVGRTGKEEPFNVRITAWRDKGWLPLTASGRHKRWWEPRLPCGSQTPLLDWDRMLLSLFLMQGTNFKAEGNKAQHHIYYLKYLQGTVWQVYLLLFKTTGDWNSNQTSETSYFYLH